MESIFQLDESYSRIERHSKLARLYLDCGEAALAREHAEAGLRTRPDDPHLLSIREQAGQFSS
jgi:hypothetical protein